MSLLIILLNNKVVQNKLGNYEKKLKYMTNLTY
jgi:hypothetical protein